MMAKMQVEGLEEYAVMLSRLGRESEEITKRAVYKGAGVVADAIREEIKALPVSNGYGSPDKQINGVTNKQKADLLEGFGLAKMENRGGYIQTKAGFEGYGSVPTRKYPKGLPNALLARSLESGTSFRKKIPFVRRAVNRVQETAQQEMAKQVDIEIEALAEKGGKY